MMKLAGYTLCALVGTSMAMAETSGQGGAQGETTDHKSQEVGQVASAPESEFEKTLIALLDKKPELIVNAIGKYTEQQQKAQQEKINKQLNTHKEVLLDKTTATVIGDGQAATKLVIFLDPNCPHCRTFEKTIHDIQKTYPHVAFFIRHWPILGNESTEAAAGLLAAGQQGKFDEVSKILIASPDRADGKKIIEWAKQAGLDMKKFESDMKSDSTQKILKTNGETAEILGFQGTPTTVLANKDGTLKIINPTDKESLVGFLKDGGSTEHHGESQSAVQAPVKVS